MSDFMFEDLCKVEHWNLAFGNAHGDPRPLRFPRSGIVRISAGVLRFACVDHRDRFVGPGSKGSKTGNEESFEIPRAPVRLIVNFEFSGVCGHRTLLSWMRSYARSAIYQEKKINISQDFVSGGGLFRLFFPSIRVSEIYIVSPALLTSNWNHNFWRFWFLFFRIFFRLFRLDRLGLTRTRSDIWDKSWF